MGAKVMTIACKNPVFDLSRFMNLTKYGEMIAENLAN